MGIDSQKLLLNDELVLFDFEASDQVDLLNKMSKILYEKGYVKSSFNKAIVEREEIFPTGLPTAGVKVAIPHTDAEHVNQSVILFAKLNQPIDFKEMGNGINVLPIEMVFMLALADSNKQAGLLGNLMNIFSEEDTLMSLKHAKGHHEVVQIVMNKISF
jgi:PTS system galactitol-specific IIA component